MLVDFSSAEKAFGRLCEIMTTLRAPNGCPWDQEQTLESLRPYLLEETYEVLDALDSPDPQHHCEELGDLLLQIVFQSEIRREHHFSITDVIQGISDKLVRRHPHVFPNANGETKDLENAAQVRLSWEQIKEKERENNSHRSALDGIPKAFPALLKAYRMGEKAASALGFDWANWKGPRAKLDEEIAELDELLQNDIPTDKTKLKEELGDVLYTIVNLSRHLGIDPESALQAASEKFAHRYRWVENAAEKSTGPLNPQQLEGLWLKAKSQ
ncbi:MAG: nucleoside triphosphate pyrophosphohydrolase [Myxococcota bacterium]|nr:nucleoside triphosphate pyrophosphohydrolase [Myxococcota bacterium]